MSSSSRRHSPPPYRRERLYDDRVVVVASPDTPPEASALELIAGQRHVVVDTERRVFPYSLLEDLGVEYRVGQLVSDYLLVPLLVALSGGLGLMRYRVAAEMATLVDLRIEECPFPVHLLGIDMVWNPHLSDQYFVSGLRQLLFDAAARRGLLR